MSFDGKILLIHFIRNIKSLLFFRLMHFFSCCFLSASQVFFQLSSLLSLASWFKTMISAILLKLAYSVSYVIADVMFINDLSEHSIIWSFHLGIAQRLLSVVSGISSMLIPLIPSFAKRSAWSFHLSLL